MLYIYIRPTWHIYSPIWDIYDLSPSHAPRSYKSKYIAGLSWTEALYYDYYKI